MLNTNKTQIDSDGNIILQNIQGSTITIHKGDDANAIMGKLSQLHDAQLDALLQIIEKQGESLEGVVKRILQDFFKVSGLEKGKYATLQEHSGSGDNVARDKNIHYYLIKHATSLPHELSINIPKTEDLSKIIGRDQDLQQVRELLQEKQKVVVVNGLGGIGKTTLVQAYLTQYASEYAHILWLGQSEGDNFVLDLITAPGLTLNLAIDTNGKDAQTLFTEIVAKLKDIHAEKPNLWVIDNANAFLSKYFDYLPKPPQWHVLATSREKMPRFFVKDLDFLGEDDAVLLFCQHCGRITDEASIRSVLKAIDYHTLTIEILAKTAQRHDTPLATLQAAIEHDLSAGVYIPHKGDKIERVTSYLLSIFDLATLRAEEQRLLQHFAALPAEYISYPLLKNLIPETETNIAATLQDLSDKGWLLYANDPEAYKMHLIIAEVVKRKMPPSVADLQGLIGNVANLLSIDQTKDNPVDKFPFVPYGEAVLTVFPEAGDVEISTLQNTVALVLQSFGAYSGAKALLEKAVRSDEANFGEDHPMTAISYSNLATVLKDLGDYAGAKVLLEKALRSDEVNFGEDHPNTLVRYSNLAAVLKDLGDYAGAKFLFEKALQIDEARFGENHPKTAVRYSNLATVLQDLGDYAGAKILLEKALWSDKVTFGENHPNTTVRYSNLATVLQNLGDCTGAKHLLEKAVWSAEANFGKNHPNTAVQYSNLALVLQKLGDYTGAKDLLEKAVWSDEVNFGENHPETAKKYSNLGILLKDFGDYAGAKGLLEKALRSNEVNFGEDHPNTTRSYSNLATVLHNIGAYAEAKILLEKALHSDEANFRENHPDAAIHYHNLGMVLMELGEYKKAMLLVNKAYCIYFYHLGQQHPDIKKIKNSLYIISEAMLENGWTQAQINELSNR